jgi:hypothetical protein
MALIFAAALAYEPMGQWLITFAPFSKSPELPAHHADAAGTQGAAPGGTGFSLDAWPGLSLDGLDGRAFFASSTRADSRRQ